MDKIIDTKHGRIRQDYNEDFIKEKNRLLDELNEAKAHKNDSIEAFNRYIDAKYAKDRFYQQHFEQRIIDDYYKLPDVGKERTAIKGRIINSIQKESFFKFKPVSCVSCATNPILRRFPS